MQAICPLLKQGQGIVASVYRIDHAFLTTRRRQYTWDKQLETWVKSAGILGGNGKEPTIISPKQYCRRFRGAISSYFTVVPGDEGVEAPLDPEAGL